MINKEMLKKEISLDPDNLEKAAWQLRLLRREMERTDSISNSQYVAIETAIWAMKVLWGKNHPELLTQEEFAAWERCRCAKAKD